jgi:hypothetical protein
VLAEGHDVDVVVDQDRGAEALGEPLRDREAVPARHDRRVAGEAGGVLDRARHADPDPRHPAFVADLVQQRVEALFHPLEHDFGPVGDLDVAAVLGQHPPPEVGDGEARVGGAEVGGEDQRRVLVEGEPLRWAPAGRLAAADLLQQAEGLQMLQPLRDRRAGEAGSPAQVRPGDAAAIADQPQQVVGTGRRAHLSSIKPLLRVKKQTFA